MADTPADQRDDTAHFDGPAGGWGSLEGMGHVAGAEGLTLDLSLIHI